MKVDIILWAMCINGEGSSLVTKKIIKSLLNLEEKNSKIIISDSSTLFRFLSSNGIIEKHRKKIIIFPSYFRNYFIQIIIKTLIPINYFCNCLITMDDFPFYLHKNQILYFQQAGIIEGNNLRWKLRRIFFQILIRKYHIIYTQTFHIKRSLLNKFNLNPKQFITRLHEV